MPEPQHIDFTVDFSTVLHKCVSHYGNVKNNFLEMEGSKNLLVLRPSL